MFVVWMRDNVPVSTRVIEVALLTAIERPRDRVFVGIVQVIHVKHQFEHEKSHFHADPDAFLTMSEFFSFVNFTFHGAGTILLYLSKSRILLHTTSIGACASWTQIPRPPESFSI